MCYQRIKQGDEEGRINGAGRPQSRPPKMSEQDNPKIARKLTRRLGSTHKGAAKGHYHTLFNQRKNRPSRFVAVKRRRPIQAFSSRTGQMESLRSEAATLLRCHPFGGV